MSLVNTPICHLRLSLYTHLSSRFVDGYREIFIYSWFDQVRSNPHPSIQNATTDNIFNVYYMFTSSIGECGIGCQSHPGTAHIRQAIYDQQVHQQTLAPIGGVLWPIRCSLNPKGH
jgi:hypothetical protein